MPTKKGTARAGKSKSAGRSKGASKSSRSGPAGRSRAASKPKPGGRARAAATAGRLSVAQFLKAGPGDGGYSAVFLVNPAASTAETLRVAWPETCIACGSWFDFPAEAVESVTPLGVEECCARPFVKAALRIDTRRADLIRMLRSHLTGTIGGELGLKAAVQDEGFEAAAVGEEELCESERPAEAGFEAVGAAAADVTTLELSGAQWVARFPGSRSIFDTKPPFLDKLSKFHAALAAAGASVRISATLRPPARAYLMHFSFRIAREGLDPRQVPPMAGVNIQWFHGDLAGSKNAAAQMVAGYGIAFRPVLRSRHTEGLAIDMDISWAGTLRIKDAAGVVRNIGAPRSGVNNAALHRVGASYGVIKLLRDRPHWSNDGH